jgi:DNA primase small subunit
MSCYEPTYYESRATAYLASQGLDVIRNVRLPVVGRRYANRPEIDALALRENLDEPRLYEFKSYPLTPTDIEGIAFKYRIISPFGVTVVAPSIPGRDLGYGPLIETIEFNPDLSEITDYYANDFVASMPDMVREALSTGLHHIRYLMPHRAPGRQKRFMNQIDKRLKSPEKIRHEILNRLPEPPTRIFWTPASFRNPKWLFAGEGDPIETSLWACDIDGTDLHEGITPCLYAGSPVCESCYKFASLAARQLSSWLSVRGHHVILTLDSGRRGFHLYVDNAARELLIMTASQRNLIEVGIRLDLGSLRHARALVGMPGSLHGFTMLPVVPSARVDDSRAELLPYRRV